MNMLTTLCILNVDNPLLMMQWLETSIHSMEHTLYDGDTVLVNRFSYQFNSPKADDIVVFMQGGSEHTFYNIKRVIGVPGDMVQIKDGIIYVNEEEYPDIIPTEPIIVSGLASEPILLEEEEYFVLGDNRNNSEDSRFANIGLILEDEIIGKAWIRIKPEFAIIEKINQLTDEAD